MRELLTLHAFLHAHTVYPQAEKPQSLSLDFCLTLSLLWDDVFSSFPQSAYEGPVRKRTRCTSHPVMLGHFCAARTVTHHRNVFFIFFYKDKQDTLSHMKNVQFLAPLSSASPNQLLSRLIKSKYGRGHEICHVRKLETLQKEWLETSKNPDIWNTDVKPKIICEKRGGNLQTKFH